MFGASYPLARCVLEKRWGVVTETVVGVVVNGRRRNFLFDKRENFPLNFVLTNQKTAGTFSLSYVVGYTSELGRRHSSQ